MRDLIRSGGSRVAILLVSLVFVTYSTRLIIGYVGPEAYGYIALVASFSALLTFSDLGMGTAITSEIARSGHEAKQVHDLIGRVNRALNYVAIVLVLIAIVTLALDLWPLILADPKLPPYISIAASISLGLFAVAVKCGIGFRVLVGTNKSHLAIYCQLIGPIVSTTICFATVSLAGPPVFLAIAVPLGAALVAVATLITAMRSSGLNLMSLRVGPRGAEDRVSIASYSLPAFAILIAAPLIFQSDRLLLAWFSTPLALAQYSVVAQLYGPATSVANALALPLWARYSSGADRTNLRRDFVRHALLFTAVGIGLGIALVIASPYYAQIVSGDTLGNLSILTAAFAVLIVVQSAHLPAGMYLTMPSGFRLLSLLYSITLILKLSLSLILVPALAAPGPVLSSVLAVAFALTTPALLFALRSISKRSRPA